MKIYSVSDIEFKPYGRIVEGMDDTVSKLLTALNETPLPETREYLAEDPALQSLAGEVVSNHLYGGMPVQIGWCNGHNTTLNCLEYHRDSEFNLGTADFILLLARLDEIVDGILDTAKVKAFKVPAGVMVECYATTMHYAPCQAAADLPFKVLVALPKGTNTEKPEIVPITEEDKILRARNKWLYAHPDSPEAHQGAYIGLSGDNIDVSKYI